MAEYIERTEALEITTRTCGDYAAAWSEIRKLPNEYGGAITPEDYCSRAVRENEPPAK